MTLNDKLNCCGLRELDGIQSKERGGISNAVKEIFEDDWDSYEKKFKCAHVIFSDAEKGHIKGRTLALEIVTNNLGSIVSSVSKVNPNSGNPLKVWVWTLNKKGLIDYAKKNKIETEENDSEDDKYW